MAYDLENHLTSVSGSASMSLAYDPKGRLRQTDASSSTVFLYDGDSLVEELDASGTPNILRRYVPGNSVDDTLVWYEGGGLGTPNMLYTDEQGSVIATANASSTSQYVYSPTGEPTSWSGTRFRYTGQAALPEVQLYYYKARMYDPHLGRFLQTDPIGYVSDYNLYAYVRNDPANKVDPSGTTCTENRAYLECNFDKILDAKGNEVDRKRLDEATQKKLEEFEKSYTKTVGKLLAHPDRSARITATSADYRGKSRSTTIMAKSLADALKSREFIAKPFTADPKALARTLGSTTVYSNGLSGAGISSLTGGYNELGRELTVGHEGIHGTDEEAILTPSGIMFQEHQDQYNNAVKLLLGIP